MKRLFFHEILLLSDKERKARQVSFHDRVTVIKAPNDFGKSCLIKSIYSVLGAPPLHTHPTWKALSVTILLTFSVDGERYSILRVGKRSSLFDAGGALIGSYLSVTTGLGPALARLLNFGLELTNKKTQRAGQATPACLFLPFYVDQDNGWTESWQSFDHLTMFTNYRQAVIDFHTGIRPNEYYKAQNIKKEAEVRREEARHERAVVKRVLDKIELLMADNNFDIDLTSYQNEIDRLLVYCNELRLEEEKIRDEMVQLDSRRLSLERQLQITRVASAELHDDFLYASEILEDDVECPICGAEYHNSFAERFGIAQDEDRLRNLLVEMTDESKECQAEIAKRREIVGEASVKIQQITELLETRQGEVRLQDVLQSEGKKEVRGVLRTELEALNLSIGEIDSDIEDAETDMKEYTSRKRSAEINGFFREKMSEYLNFLNVTGLSEENYKTVSTKFHETGSDLPRALLAYYFAILYTIEENSTAAFCPIVIDSPKQQDLDDSNWLRELEFMRDNLPPRSQLIVGLVNDLGIDLGGSVIELKRERQLLQESEYSTVAALLRPFIDASLAN